MFHSLAAPHLRKHIRAGEPIDIGRDLSLAQSEHRPAISLSNPSACSPRRCLRRNPAQPEFASKPLPPGLKIRLARVEALAVMAQRPNGQVHVGMPVVEVLDEDVVVIAPERLDGKCPSRILDGNGIGASRHRQNDVDRKRTIAAALVVETGIILPALLQVFQSGTTRQRRALLCFRIELTVSRDVCQVRLEVRHALGAAGDLDHHLWCSAYDALELCTHRRRKAAGSGRIGDIPLRPPWAPIRRFPDIRDRRKFGGQVGRPRGGAPDSSPPIPIIRVAM
ncbi:hypothetical protein ABIB99_008002 [Bradyrhizobium sp. LA6.1]